VCVCVRVCVCVCVWVCGWVCVVCGVCGACAGRERVTQRCWITVQHSDRALPLASFTSLSSNAEPSSDHCQAGGQHVVGGWRRPRHHYGPARVTDPGEATSEQRWGWGLASRRLGVVGDEWVGRLGGWVGERASQWFGDIWVGAWSGVVRLLSCAFKCLGGWVDGLVGCCCGVVVVVSALACLQLLRVRRECLSTEHFVAHLVIPLVGPSIEHRLPQAL
jgi:hypothetical protein